MAISTYAELQTAIGNWLGRPGDATIAAIIPDWIAVRASLQRQGPDSRDGDGRQRLVEYRLVAKQLRSSGEIAALTTP